MSTQKTLDENHYLGSRGSRPKITYENEGSVMVFSGPSSRRLPSDWLELSRWCITSGNGSEHWKNALIYLKKSGVEATTIVSYSDPSVGHTGALYRASNWIWAPTWHVLRPPPSGNGTRAGKRQEPKHRWVYLLKPDARRESLLALKDGSMRKKYPYAEYLEPKWRKNVALPTGRESAYRKWAEENGQVRGRPE